MLRPLTDQVIIIRDDAPDQTEGGIVIPDQAKEPLTRGVVMAVGPGKHQANKIGNRLFDAWERHLQTHRLAQGSPMDRVVQDVVQALSNIAPTVQPGDKVLFGTYTGNPARIKDAEGVEHDCVLCREEEIYGVIEE